MNQNNSVERLQQATVPFFEQARELNDTRLYRFTAFAGVEMKTAKEAFPGDQWATKQEEWMLIRLRKVMDDLFQTAKVRKDFGIPIIRKHVKISKTTFSKIAGQEWRKRYELLPTSNEHASKLALAKLSEMVEANFCVIEKIK